VTFDPVICGVEFEVCRELVEVFSGVQGIKISENTVGDGASALSPSVVVLTGLVAILAFVAV
jgi:hypothetical protein